MLQSMKATTPILLTHDQANLLRTIVAEGVCHEWPQNQSETAWTVGEEYFRRNDGNILIDTGMIIRHPDPKHGADIRVNATRNAYAYVASRDAIKEVERRAVIASMPTEPLRAPRSTASPSRGAR